jgi:hypothetical protein
MVAKHFEDLWEECEKLHAAFNAKEPISTVMDELSMKINLYKMLDSKDEIPKEEIQKIKSRTLGEILLTLTHLSLKENINVFDALNTAKNYRQAENYSKIPPELRLPKP